MLSLSLSAGGSVPSPFDCYLANRGLKTLHLRMREHQRNAFAVARFLESSPYAEDVVYPGEGGVVYPGEGERERGRCRVSGERKGGVVYPGNFSTMH